MKPLNVAIDGPSGAGKSSVADAAAARFGLHHLDTGAMYRAVALALDRQGIAPCSGPELEKALEAVDLQMEKDGRVLLDKEDVTQAIRTPEISSLASEYSALPEVRSRLVAMQQKIAAAKGFILDGRDICDVVLPDAEVKIYLDAAPQARAARRLAQDAAKGIELSYEEVLRSIVERDQKDSSRKQTPLKISAQASVIDSSDLDFDQTVQAVCDLIDAAQKGA